MDIDSLIVGKDDSECYAYTDCHKSIPFEAIFRVAVEIWVYFGFWNSDFGFKVFYLFYSSIERSDTANLKSKIC